MIIYFSVRDLQGSLKITNLKDTAKMVHRLTFEKSVYLWMQEEMVSTEGELPRISLNANRQFLLKHSPSSSRL